jgi:hypothetical protein
VSRSDHRRNDGVAQIGQLCTGTHPVQHGRGDVTLSLSDQGWVRANGPGA